MKRRLPVSEKFVKHVPSADQVILGNKVSETDSVALRLARATTEKERS
jgi:glutamate-1-semialdehyde aminotransferase